MAEHPDHDIVIVGGGPVGCALALGLAASRCSVLLLDATAEPQPGDPRTLALSYGSRLILQRLGVWADIEPRTEIRTIHVSQRGGFGSAVLTAADAQTPALGYVVPYTSVQRGLHTQLTRLGNLQIQRRARVMQIEQQLDALRVNYADDHGHQGVTAGLTVIADGGALAQQLAQVEVRDYRQSAVVCNITTSIPNRHTAFERFTQEGPIALLPRATGYAVVWTVSPEKSQALCGAEPDDFVEQLQATFGMRAGKFLSVQDRAAFPLALRVAHASDLARMILIGNAAQALHPVAGQGLNLGLRDAWELASRLSSAPGDADAVALAQQFLRDRQRDRRMSVILTDAMVRTFSNRNLALQWLRGCGLTILDCVPPAKHKFMQQMMFGSVW